MSVSNLSYQKFARDVRDGLWQSFKDHNIEFDGIGTSVDEEHPEETAFVLVMSFTYADEPLVLPFKMSSVYSKGADEFIRITTEMFL